MVGFLNCIQCPHKADYSLTLSGDHMQAVFPSSFLCIFSLEKNLGTVVLLNDFFYCYSFV